MREAVIVASSRTPLAKSFRGSFNLTRPDDLAAHCITDVLRKVPQLDPAEIEDVFLGCAVPEGQQGDNVARVAAIRAGLPVSVAGATVNRFCSSGLQAIALAAHEIMHEGAEAAIGGGVESITASANVKRDPEPVGAGAQARRLHGHGRHGRGRREAVQDRPRGPGRIRPLAASSARRGPSRKASSRRNWPRCASFAASSTSRPGRSSARKSTPSSSDECNRPDTTIEGLRALKPYFDPEERAGDGDGRATRRNSPTAHRSRC